MNENFELQTFQECLIWMEENLKTLQELFQMIDSVEIIHLHDKDQ